LLTDLNLNLQNPPLGFLNPWLYDVATTNSTAFRDIVMGDNSCSELAWICCPYGLSAAVGWDAVTGLGSLNYGVLADIIRGL
jgi:tripeptidyl-peptidase-1